MSGTKGARAEREFVDECGARKWAALRCPASGAASTRDLPDVLAVRPSRAVPTACDAIAVEIKSRSDGKPRLEGEEVEALRRFAVLAGATPYIAVRPSFRKAAFSEWGLWKLGELNETPTAYSITANEWTPDAYRTLDDVLGPVCNA